MQTFFLSNLNFNILKFFIKNLGGFSILTSNECDMSG